MIDDKREEDGGESQEQARTFTEEQSALFSNPHGTPEAMRPRTPGTDSVPPDSAEATRGGEDDGEQRGDPPA